MSLDVAKNYIDEAVGLGAKAVQLTGGEPLVYPHLREVIRYASDAGLMTILATSGYGCSDEMCADLESCGLTVLCVSVNGISQATNHKSRSTFAESLSALHTVKSYDIFCFLNVVVTDDNIQELDVLSKYAQNHGVSGINILRPVPSHDGKYVPHFSEETLRKLVEITRKSPDLFNVEGCHTEYWKYLTGKPFSCQDIGKKTYFVNVDGSVSPCSKTMQYKYHSLSEMLSRYSDWECGCL